MRICIQRVLTHSTTLLTVSVSVLTIGQWSYLMWLLGLHAGVWVLFHTPRGEIEIWLQWEIENQLRSEVLRSHLPKRRHSLLTKRYPSYSPSGEWGITSETHWEDSEGGYLRTHRESYEWRCSSVTHRGVNKGTPNFDLRAESVSKKYLVFIRVLNKFCLHRDSVCSISMTLPGPESPPWKMCHNLVSKPLY